MSLSGDRDMRYHSPPSSVPAGLSSLSGGSIIQRMFVVIADQEINVLYPTAISLTEETLGVEIIANPTPPASLPPSMS